MRCRTFFFTSYRASYHSSFRSACSHGMVVHAKTSLQTGFSPMVRYPDIYILRVADLEDGDHDRTYIIKA